MIRRMGMDPERDSGEDSMPTDAEINRLVQACRPSSETDGTLGTVVPMGFEAVQALVTRFARRSEAALPRTFKYPGPNDERAPADAQPKECCKMHYAADNLECKDLAEEWGSHWAERFCAAFNVWACADEGSGEESQAQLAVWKIRDEYEASRSARRRRESPSPLAQVFGKWPGDETDEEIHAAMEEPCASIGTAPVEPRGPVKVAEPKRSPVGPVVSPAASGTQSEPGCAGSDGPTAAGEIPSAGSARNASVERGVCRKCNRWVSNDRRGGNCEECSGLSSGIEALITAAKAWDALFTWTEPFEGYDEEKALHRALDAHTKGSAR